MATRVSITSNPKKLKAKMEKAIGKKKKALNEAVTQYVLASFETTLQNTPTDTGQLMANWNFYITRGEAPFVRLPDYNARRHDRYDYSGRRAMHEIAVREQMMVIKRELAVSGINFLKKGRTRITVGIKNEAPYFDVLDKGLYRVKPPLVNVTPNGYSIQAPQGIIRVTLSSIKGENEFKQFIGVRGVST